MTLQELLQIVGGIGVISSFIYAAIRVRRNTRALRAATYQQVSQSIIGEFDELAKNRDLCEVMLRGSDDFGSLDRTEKARFRFLILGYLKPTTST
jgi:hypothetical protein